MATKLVVLLLFTLVVANSDFQSDTDNDDYSSGMSGESYPPFNESCSDLILAENLVSDPNDHEEIKKIVDRLLNNCCSNATTTAIPQCIAITTISPTQCSETVKNTQMPYTTTVTVSSPCPVMSPSTPTLDLSVAATAYTNCQSSQRAVNGITPTNMALGASLGLSVLLLALVITGWACTCLTTKKRKKIKGVNTDETEFEEKYFENPTYDGTSMIRIQGAVSPGAYKVPVLPVAAHKPQANDTGATYDAINTGSPKTAGKGQTYDVLNRGKVNGKRSTARNVRAPKGYSQLGLPDKDVDNNYHLINKENYQMT